MAITKPGSPATAAAAGTARKLNYPSFLAFMHYQDSGDDLGNIEAAMTDQQSAF